MQNEDEVPRLDITICIDPPNDTKDQIPPSTNVIHWTSDHYNFQSYPRPSEPQAIPRISTSHEDLHSPSGLWEARSPCSSDSGLSNPSSPLLDQFCGEDFRDDGSDYYSDSRSYVSDQEVFDIDAFLNLTTETQSPDNTYFPSEYLSGPDPYQSPTLLDPSPFPTQSLPYTSPYTHNRGPSSSSLDYANDFSSVASGSNNLPSVKPTHQRSTSDYLAPPSPTMHRSARSHSRGSGGHRFTISEGAVPHFSSDVTPESSMFLAGDIRGRGLSRAKTAPSSKAISRGRSPYERPASQTAVSTRLVIPNYVPVSGQSSPECPSPGSAKGVVATDAMLQASARRRTREATYFCSKCNASFTTENSRKRHENSHSGEKPFLCSVPGCGQTFSNDDDRKRHENKSKKHAPR